MDKSKFDFNEWPLDLLMDYALKMHHRRIRNIGPKILDGIERLTNKYPSLNQVKDLFEASLSDLDNHLMKEENVLFPFLYDLYEAAETQHPIMEMHCGTIKNPISVMEMEHEAETNRHLQIKKLTNDYSPSPSDDSEYNKVMAELHDFFLDLQEHTHIENDIIFPCFEKLEEKWILR